MLSLEFQDVSSVALRTAHRFNCTKHAWAWPVQGPCKFYRVKKVLHSILRQLPSRLVWVLRVHMYRGMTMFYDVLCGYRVFKLLHCSFLHFQFYMFTLGLSQAPSTGQIPCCRRSVFAESVSSGHTVGELVPWWMALGVRGTAISFVLLKESC